MTLCQRHRLIIHTLWRRLVSRGTETFFYSIRRNIGNERFSFGAYSDATTQLFTRKASICFAGLKKLAFSPSRNSRRQSTITRLAFRTGQIRVRANYAIKSDSTLWDLTLDIDRVKAISCIFLRGSFPPPLVRWRVTREEKEKYRRRKRWAQNRCSLSVELNKRVTVIITHSGARI